jgi:hypothetical protein
MMFAGMRHENVYHDGKVVTGLGDSDVAAPVVRVPPSPWLFAVATSVISAATGWVIEEAARAVRKRKRR